MEIHKWIESEKAHCDLGDPVIIDWINKYAEQFRKEWKEKYDIIEDENGMCCQSSSRISTRSST